MPKQKPVEYISRLQSHLKHIQMLPEKTRVDENRIKSLQEMISRYDEEYSCRECGEMEFPRCYLNHHELRTAQLCFSCLHWHELMALKDDAATARIQGTHYRIAKEDCGLPSRERGCAGRKFTIRFFDGRQITTTNLWVQGEIPQRFRDRMPDNAEFIR